MARSIQSGEKHGPTAKIKLPNKAIICGPLESKDR